MITVSDELKTEQLELSVSPHIFKAYAYKQYDGEIDSYGTSTFTVIGDASHFAIAGDIIIISCSNLNTEYTVATSSYDGVSGKTTIYVTPSGNFIKSLPHKDRFYKRYGITEYVSSIGDIRKFIEDKSFGKLRPFQLNLSLIDDLDEFQLSGNKSVPGIFFKGFYQSQVISSFKSGNFTAVNVSDSIIGVYDPQIFKLYTMKILDGELRGTELKICSISNLYKRIYVYGDYSDDISVGDTIYVSIQSKYMIKLIYGIRHYTSDDINVFFGVAYSRNVTKGNKRIDLIAYSFIKDWDNEYAYQVSNEATRLSKIPGIEAYKYDLASRSPAQESLVDVEYKFSSGNLQGVTGIKIVDVSTSVGTDLRLLRYKKPNKFQWSNGSWTTLASEATSQTLTADDDSYIKVDCKPKNYPSTDAEECIYMNVLSKMEVAVNGRGPAGLRIDNGNWIQLFTKFFRLWRDDSYTVGTLNDEVDMYDISVLESPVKIIPTSPSDWAVYFGLTQKFGALEIIGLKELGTSLSGITWEYSLSYGDDPSCFSSLTVVDGTNGFSNDGVISWDIPDDWAMKAKVGVSTDFHMYWIRMKAASGAERNVEQILPYTTAFGSSKDAFTFKTRWELFSKENIKDNLIIKYDSNGELTLAVWKQCIRAIDVYTDLVDKSGYGINKSVITDAGLNILNKPDLNVWGKPFNADYRSPSAMCLGTGTCTGYIFAAFKNALFRLKSETDEWELLYECDRFYTIVSLGYFDGIVEDSSERYFILASGFEDAKPRGTLSETKYFEQPKQIMIRIDDVNGDDFFTTIGHIDNGGTDVGHSAFTDGDGLFDTRFLMRGGVSYNAGDAYECIIGSFSTYLWGENLVIPFNQLVMRLNNFDTQIVPNDVEVDVISVIDERISSIIPDTVLPTWLDPGFYMVETSLDSGSYSEQGAMDVRCTFGQKGGMCKVYFPNVSVITGYGIFGQGRFEDVDWIDQRRIFTMAYMGYGKGAISGVLSTDNSIGYGCGQFPKSPYNGGQFKARTELLCSFQMPEDITDDETDYVIVGTYVDFYQMSGTSKYNEKRLELVTRRKSLAASMFPDDMTIQHYNSSNVWQTAILSTSLTPYALAVAQSEYIIIADDRKFERLYMEVNNSAAVVLDVYFYDAAGSWISCDMNNDEISGSGVRTGEVSFPLDRRWAKGTLSPNITDQYMIKIVITNAGTMTLNKFGVTRREIWNSRDQSYWGSGTTKYYDFVPLDVVYSEYDSYAYGCMLDQLTLEYYMFSYGNKEMFFTDADEYTCELYHTQFDDPDMQPVSFVVDNDTGDIYCVLTDRKFRRKTAELWKITFNTSSHVFTKTKLTEIMVGEWDCRVDLICYNSKVYGFTAPNHGYFWQWADEFYLRIPIFDSKVQKIRESLSSVGQLVNLISYTDGYAKTLIDYRFKEQVSYDAEWGIEEVQNIEFVRELTSHVDGVIVSWNDGEVSGREHSGDININSSVLTIDNPYVMFPQTARQLSNFLWKYLVKNGREIEGAIIFLYQHQINDVVLLRGYTIPWISDRDIDNISMWQIKSMTISWKTKKIKVFLIEGSTDYDSAS